MLIKDKKKALNIIDTNFINKGAIKGFSSVILNLDFLWIGDMEFTVNLSIENADELLEDRIIWLGKEVDKAFIIERAEDELVNGSFVRKVKAISIKSLLKDYVTIPSTGNDYDTITALTREDGVRQWVNNNCINPADTSRIQYDIVLGVNNSYGDVITEKTRNKNLAEEITRILSTENLGWNLVVDIPNKQFVFNVIKGTDRSDAQTLISKVFFGLKYANLGSFKKIKDKQSEKNIAYVGGKGEGATRTIVKVTSGTGRRREVFIDARDLDTNDELIERGNQKLSELSATDEYEVTILDKKTYTYDEDYYLGDTISIVVDKSNIDNKQILKVKEVYEESGFQVTPIMGKSQSKMSDVIRSVKDRIASTETI